MHVLQFYMTFLYNHAVCYRYAHPHPHQVQLVGGEPGHQRRCESGVHPDAAEAPLLPATAGGDKVKTWRNCGPK